MKQTCTGNIESCLKCEAYYKKHGPVKETINNKNRSVITITCCFGTSGKFDANTKERILEERK